MNVLFAASEVVPFAKTGGLADVTGALPAALEKLGHRVSVILPHYQRIQPPDLPVQPTGVKLQIPIAKKTVEGELLQSELPGTGVRVLLVHQPDYFDRDELYRAGGEDYRDNCERFVFFSRSVLEAVRLLELEVDCIHAHDWQTGLVPAYLEIEYRQRPGYEQIGSVFTVHNLAYQGKFWHWDMLLTGLDWKYFKWQRMEFYGHLSLLKTGLVFADVLTTVSKRYAEEIQTPQYGCRLDGVLRQRSDDLTGIMNGIDYGVWNPATDPHIAAQYDETTFNTGKARCKAALQKRNGLPTEPDVPLIGMISRLADQKGFDLLVEVADDLFRENVQLVILGTGEPKYHKLLDAIHRRHPQRLALNLTFDDALAHQIEGGADLFLMPSRYEPCGLNQLYSLKYGTVPVVRETGGLADSIVDADSENVASGEANGFSFRDYTAEALWNALRRALRAYEDDELWSQLIRTGMRMDWSWQRSAREYVKVYQRARSRHGESVYA